MPVAKKHPPVKKSRRGEISKLMSPEAQRKAEREAKKVLDAMDERADERYAYAQAILEINPPEVEEAVERMVGKMNEMSGPPKFVIDGVPVNVEQQILNSIQHKLHTWVAVRLLVACAKWDIRIANFKLPANACADCGKAVKKR